MKKINDAGKVYMIPAKLPGDVYFIRFAVCSRYTEEGDIAASWDEIRRQADDLLLATDNNSS